MGILVIIEPEISIMAQSILTRLIIIIDQLSVGFNGCWLSDDSYHREEQSVPKAQAAETGVGISEHHFGLVHILLLFGLLVGNGSLGSIGFLFLLYSTHYLLQID